MSKIWDPSRGRYVKDTGRYATTDGGVHRRTSPRISGPAADAAKRRLGVCLGHGCHRIAGPNGYCGNERMGAGLIASCRLVPGGKNPAPDPFVGQVYPFFWEEQGGG